MDLGSAIGEGFPEHPCVRAGIEDLSRTISTGFLDDGINELLRLAGVSTEDAAARRCFRAP